MGSESPTDKEGGWDDFPEPLADTGGDMTGSHEPPAVGEYVKWRIFFFPLAKAIQAGGANRLPLLLSSQGVNPVSVEVDDTNVKF